MLVALEDEEAVVKARKEGTDYAKSALEELGVVAESIKAQADAPVNCVNFVLQVQTADFPKVLSATGLKGIIYQRRKGEQVPESAAGQRRTHSLLAPSDARADAHPRTPTPLYAD